MIKMFGTRLAGCKRNFLSKGGRLILIRSALSDLPIFFLSALTILVKMAKKIGSHSMQVPVGVKKGEEDIT